MGCGSSNPNVAQTINKPKNNKIAVVSKFTPSNEDKKM